jgi:DNA-binding transcriptional LysR family regulator
MEFKHIEAFLKVVEKGSFSLAAESMYITQPTISSRIQKLEQELDTVLFERNGGKKALLTPQGKKIYPFYREALRCIVKGNEVLSYDKHGFGMLRISCPNHLGQFILPNVLKSLYQHFPHIDFNVNVSKTDQIIEDIIKGETDVGLIFLNIKEENEDYTITPIAMEKTILVASPNHPLALAKDYPLNITDLQEEKFIVFARASNKFYVIDRFLKEHGLKEYNTIEIKNLEWIKSMVKSDFGISFLQKNMVEAELQNHTLEEVILTNPLPPTPISLIYRNQVPSEIHQLISQKMKEIFNENEGI